MIFNSQQVSACGILSLKPINFYKSNASLFCERWLTAADLLHSVQSAACAEPLDLQVVESVVQLDVFALPISVRNSTG